MVPAAHNGGSKHGERLVTGEGRLRVHLYSQTSYLLQLILQLFNLHPSTMSLNYTHTDEPDAPLPQQQLQQPKPALEQDSTHEQVSTHEQDPSHEQVRWEDLESYTGSSDDERLRPDHGLRAMYERDLRWASVQHDSPSAVTESSVRTYDEEDIEWWHGVVGEPHNGLWDQIQIFVLLVFMFVVCFVAGVTIWILVR